MESTQVQQRRLPGVSPSTRDFTETPGLIEEKDKMMGRGATRIKWVVTVP